MVLKLHFCYAKPERRQKVYAGEKAGHWGCREVRENHETEKTKAPDPGCHFVLGVNGEASLVADS